MKSAFFRAICAAFLVSGIIAGCDELEEQVLVVDVESISINQEDMTLTVGESTTLTATVLPEEATEKAVTWSSSDETKVMVSSSGKVAALTPGAAVVTAKAGEKSDFITITVVAKPIPVTGVSLDKSSITVKAGESETLTATITPEDATNKKVSWTSSDEEVATVTEGVVTGVKAGNAIITVMTEDGGKTAECAVTVKHNLAPSVTLGEARVSAISAILSGEANLETSMSSDMTMGIMWSLNSGVVPSNSTKIEAKEINAKADFEASYEYNVGVTGLEAGTTYYYRSYVTQNGQDTYGETKSFTTKELGTMIRTSEASAISAISARMNSFIDLTDVQFSSVSYGFYYGTSSDALSSNVSASEEESAVYANLSLLLPSTEYFFKGFVDIDGKRYTSDEVKSFTTKELGTMIRTTEASAISAISARMNCFIDLTDVQFSKISFGFNYGRSSDALSSSVSASEEESITYADLSALTPSTEYFFRGFVDVDGKRYTSDEVKRFTTKEQESMLVTLDATEIEATSATLNAKLDLTDVLLTAKEYGFYWGASANNLSQKKSGGSITDNTYTAPLTGLAHKTQYWYKSYLILGSQTFYGEVKTFTTDVVPVESVSLDQTEYTFHTIGNTLTLAATVLPADATDKSISWVSSDESVATVDNNGKVTAIDNGTATITVTSTDQEKTATCTITVAQYVTGISLNKTSISLNEGESETLTATVSSDNANDKTLIWTSSNEAIATVDQNGKVTAVSKGTATIKATAKDGSGVYATCSVVVTRLVSSITFKHTSISVYNGAWTAISATVSPSTANNKGLTWESSNTSVATVNQDGVVTGVARGKATITATAKDGSGVSTSCEVEVKQYVTGIYLSRSGLSLIEGETQTISVATVTPDDANDKSVTWSSSDESVATVDQNGVITAVSKGDATIKATANDGSRTRATCRVTVVRLVSSITLDKTSMTINNGNTDAIHATVNPSTASNTGISWSSSNSSVVRILDYSEYYDEYGNCIQYCSVSGRKRGTATITATARDGSGVVATCEVEVKQQVTDIYLSHNELYLIEGQSSTLTATVSPDNADDKTLTWVSKDESVATVDQNGKITAVSKGTAIIQAITNDGGWLYASCLVTVVRPVSSITLDKTSISIYTGETETISATVSPSSASNTSIYWLSYDSSVATVSQSGVITGVARGIVTIAAASNDGSGIVATCEVEVKQHVTAVSLDESYFDLVTGDVRSLVATVSPDNANDKSLTWTSDNPSVVSVDANGQVTAVGKGRASITVTSNDGAGKNATCDFLVSISCPTGAVDLGLRSADGYRLYWAASNLSTSGLCANPEDAGDYYAWGETEPHYSSLDPLVWKSGRTGYTGDNYGLCTGSFYSDLTKYNTDSDFGIVDNKTVLELADDAAHAKLGGKWRMPTDEEWTELMNNCTWTLTDNYNGTGVAGRIVTSNVKDYTDKSIFLPAAGDWYDTYYLYVGSYGYYWSSSLDVDHSIDARQIVFYSASVFRSHGSRYYGYPIRPVAE